MFGVTRAYSGQMRAMGKVMRDHSIHTAMTDGIAMLASNRKENSVIPDMSILENMYLSEHTLSAWKPAISKKKEVYGPSLRDVTDEIDKPLHVITFNVDPDWWKDVSAFKISGYVDINFNANAEISFELKAGYFDKNTNTFCPPAISFSPDISTERSCIPDVKEITKAHHNHLLNIASGSVILFALLFYLLYVGVKNEINVACVIVSILIISFVILTVWLILHSFRKRKALIIALNSQQSK